VRAQELEKGPRRRMHRVGLLTRGWRGRVFELQVDPDALDIRKSPAQGFGGCPPT
jgi:hypothetical protein